MENTITEGYFGQELKSIKIIKDDLIGNIYVCQHDNGSYELYNNDGEGAMSLSSIHIKDFKIKPIDFNERLKEVLKSKTEVLLYNNESNKVKSIIKNILYIQRRVYEDVNCNLYENMDFID